MFTIPQRVHSLARRSKHSIFSTEEARSWQLCSPGTLRVTLSRMANEGALVRLKKGVYYAAPVGQPDMPVDDAMYAAQLMYDGYLAFATALQIHRLAGEVPFTVFVATRSTSSARHLGVMEIRAVALRDRAVGAERKGDYLVSTRPKTLYDCLRLPRLAGGEVAVAKALRRARLTLAEWKEFASYVKRFETAGSSRQLQATLEKAGIRAAYVNWKKQPGRGI